MTSLSFETVTGDNCSKVGDISISWREMGAGFPLQMISGFGTTKDIWEQSVTDRLAEKYRVIVFDNRGMGGSSAGEKQFNIRQFADDARGLMEAMGIERAHVLGWSMGSLISQELALGFPEQITKLVLYASFSDWSFPPSEDVIEKLSDPSGTSEERGMRWIETLFPLDWLKKNGERVEEIF